MVPGASAPARSRRPNPLLDWIRAAMRRASGHVGLHRLDAAGRGGIRRGSRPHALDVARPPARVRRAPHAERVVEQGKVITAAGRLVGHRHGAHAGRPHRGRRRGPGHPARHRVRPAAALRAGSRETARAHRRRVARAGCGRAWTATRRPRSGRRLSRQRSAPPARALSLVEQLEREGAVGGRARRAARRTQRGLGDLLRVAPAFFALRVCTSRQYGHWVVHATRSRSASRYVRGIFPSSRPTMEIQLDEALELRRGEAS